MHDTVRISLMNSNDIFIGRPIDGAHCWDQVIDYTCNYIRDAGCVELVVAVVVYGMDHESNPRLCYAARYRGGR